MTKCNQCNIVEMFPQCAVYMQGVGGTIFNLHTGQTSNIWRITK